MNIPCLPKRYAALASIGEGGEGRVFRVYDALREAEYALKLAPLALSEWLHREFETLRGIRHENVIRVFDWGVTTGNEPFYTMELVVGTDWSMRMRPPQLQDDVVEILLGVLRGLGHLHSHGEIHGDLKPSNVLLGSDGCVKLTDIGMGAAHRRDVISGTPGYSAPELWRGARPDERADLYSVGVMAYEALTGRHPFEGRTIREVVSGQLEGWVPSPAAHGIQLQPDLERSVMRALERDPNLRPATADEMMDMLGYGSNAGRILGGRFHGRTAELQTLAALLESDDPNSPTLVWVGGESGVGKSALIEELAYLATKRGTRLSHVLRISDFGVFRVPSSPSFGESERIWTLARERPTMFLIDIPEDDHGVTSTAVRTLARHMHALSREHGVRSQVIIVCETHLEVAATERFESALSLVPLNGTETLGYVQGHLGNVVFQPEIVDWLTTVAGGLPARLSSVLDELIDAGVIRRYGGQWQFRESQDLPSLEASLKRGRWRQEWERLDGVEQAVVALLALMPQGLDREALEQAACASRGQIESLIVKGWLRKIGSSIQLAAGEARRAALNADPHLTSEAEFALLRMQPNPLRQEERAFLLLRNVVSTESLNEGLWAAAEARERGDLRVAVERAEMCLQLAERLGEETGVERARLILGHAFHRMGRNGDALRYLFSDGEGTSAAKEELIGAIRRSQGDLGAARIHLTKAIELAEDVGDRAVFLRSHAELAEVDWRHGDERAREMAIARVQGALESGPSEDEDVNHRAALIYQLGSALIVGGRRAEARTVLEAGLELAPDDYWTMRIANALATAEYYLGRFDVALSWMDEAWRRAERAGLDLFKARIFSNRAGVHYGLGRFKEAVEYHRLSALWANRTGQRFEHLAACSGEAVTRMYLGDYEEALSRAREAQDVAAEVKNEYQAIKNLETEALCLMLIGDYGEASRLSEAVLRKSQEFGYSDMTPRALALKAMLCEIDGGWEEAKSLLMRAEEMLLKSQDWEDLPAVQIELEWIRAQNDPRAALERLTVIVRVARESGAVICQLRGALVMGEILLAGGIDDTEYRSTLLTALGRASEASASEEEWRLNFVLGELCLRSGDRKVAMIRFAQALRGLRLIADRLGSEHREYYLRTAHAVRLLAKVSGPL